MDMSIRDELWELVDEFVNSDHGGDMKPLADEILASPVIHRIQVEARERFADDLTRKGVYSFNIHDIRKYAKEGS